MAKRLKLGIRRVFQSCGSKDDQSTLASNPVPSFLSTHHHHDHDHGSSLRRHVSSAFISVGCGFRSGSTLSHNQPHHDFHWEHQDKWHVLAKLYPSDDRTIITTPRRKIYNSSADDENGDSDDVFPLPRPPRDRKKKRRVRKKKTTARFRMSTSSADGCGLFSEEEEEESETQLVSSKKTKRGGRRSISVSAPARLSMLLRVMPWKVRESFAVVKTSEDPYEDFRRSMMEMIMEKQMFEQTDLEQLLHCFLSLNSTQYHALILLAFTHIWEALFTTPPL